MNADQDANGRPALLKTIFFLISTLVAGAVGYAAWIVISYWDSVGV